MILGAEIQEDEAVFFIDQRLQRGFSARGSRDLVTAISEEGIDLFQPYFIVIDNQKFEGHPYPAIFNRPGSAKTLMKCSRMMVLYLATFF